MRAIYMCDYCTFSSERPDDVQQHQLSHHLPHELTVSAGSEYLSNRTMPNYLLVEGRQAGMMGEYRLIEPEVTEDGAIQSGREWFWRKGRGRNR